MDNRKNILCFGDSNTWGCIPRWAESTVPSERYDESIRWPMVLQRDLGPDYKIIEEGLGGRTTIYPPPAAPWKCGEPYLAPCLFTHRPLDLVVMMLGTNDLQKAHQPPYQRLGDGIRRLVTLIRENPNCGRGQAAPRILLIAPTYIQPSSPEGRVLVYPKFNGDVGRALSLAFPEVYERVAQEMDCDFLDASRYAQPSVADGVHFTPESHVRLGHAVAEYIQTHIF